MFKSGAEPPTEDWVCAGTLEELKAKGMTVLRGGSCPLLVVHDHDSVYALDNRCPHLGFPLHRGSVEDGILTCHWHHARFDLVSGGPSISGRTTSRPLRSSCGMTEPCGSADGRATPMVMITGATGCMKGCSTI